MLTAPFFLLALQALAATAAPSASPEQGGLRIPLAKRQFDILNGDVVQPELLRALLGYVQA